MRLRSIIIDDEEIGIETLSMVIEKHIPDVKVVAHSTEGQAAIELIEDYKPDIVFLDISMPEMDGFELLKKLSWRNFHLIFTTAHQEYALQAIKQNALDYILKPVDPTELQQAVNRIKQKMALQHKYAKGIDEVPLEKINPAIGQKLVVSSKYSVESLDPMEIISLESRSNYTLISRGSEPILTPKTLGEFEDLLCEGNVNFMRVHHSFIINIHKIKRYIKESDTIVMINDQKVPLSRSKRDLFFKWLDSLKG